MGKFNVKSIKGYEENQGLQIQSEQNGETKLKLGAGLLSDVSKSTIKMEVTHIEREKIEKNPKNKYSIKGIESLKESIRVYGLSEPLEVKELPDGRYMLLGGERRITAIDELIEDESVKDWNEYTLIPCVVKDLDDINIELSEENKEKFAILTTNKESRKYTEADKYYEIQAWKEIIGELRKNGVDTFTTADEDGEEKTVQIRGEKTREILAKTTGMSRGQINKYEAVDKNATEDIKNALLNDRLSVAAAAKASKELTKEEQDNLARASASEKITEKDVTKFKKTESGNKILTLQDFRKDIKGIQALLKDKEIKLDESELRSYYLYINKIEKILGSHT